MSWLDDIIEEGEDILDAFNAEDAAYYISRSITLLTDSGVEKPRVGMQTQKQRVESVSPQGAWSTPAPSNRDYSEDVSTLVMRFKRLRDEAESDVKGAGGALISIDARNENVNSVSSESISSAMALATATYTEAVKAIDSLDTIDENQKGELFDLLNDVRKTGGDEALSRSAIKSLIDHAIELGLDALKAVLPYVWAILISLGGAA